MKSCGISLEPDSRRRFARRNRSDFDRASISLNICSAVISLGVPATNKPFSKHRGNSQAVTEALLLSIRRAQIFPALERDRDVAVFPDEIVEGAETEFFPLSQAGFGEEFCDLEFADLVGDGLAWSG
jgi:hypothetical protein